MPPAPSTPTTSYTPRRVPDVRGNVCRRLYRPGQGGPHAAHISQLRKSSSAAMLWFGNRAGRLEDAAPRPNVVEHPLGADDDGRPGTRDECRLDSRLRPADGP